MHLRKYVVACLNIFSLEDSFDKRVSMDIGICLIMFGGWLLLVCTYSIVFPGFM